MTSGALHGLGVGPGDPDLITAKTASGLGGCEHVIALRKTAMILVGRALSRELPTSKLYDPAFSHEFRTGDRP